MTARHGPPLGLPGLRASLLQQAHLPAAARQRCHAHSRVNSPLSGTHRPQEELFVLSRPPTAAARQYDGSRCQRPQLVLTAGAPEEAAVAP